MKSVTHTSGFALLLAVLACSRTASEGSVGESETGHGSESSGDTTDEESSASDETTGDEACARPDFSYPPCHVDCTHCWWDDDGLNLCYGGVTKYYCEVDDDCPTLPDLEGIPLNCVGGGDGGGTCDLNCHDHNGCPSGMLCHVDSCVWPAECNEQATVCPHSLCEVEQPVQVTCDPCAAIVCEQNPGCCSPGGAWYESCVEYAIELCGLECP